MTDIRLQPPTQLALCESTRVRQGVEETCNDEAVALALAGDMVYPVCAFHTRSMTALTIGQARKYGWLS